MFTESALEFMTPPDPTELGGFTGRGGKLIVLHGVADPVFSANDTLGWYRALLAEDASARDNARLFLVPGMNHCTGGPATERFDAFEALEAWLDGGAAPESLAATLDPQNPDVAALGWPATRSRPLCAYPTRAVLTSGASDIERADSFTCE